MNKLFKYFFATLSLCVMGCLMMGCSGSDGDGSGSGGYVGKWFTLKAYTDDNAKYLGEQVNKFIYYGFTNNSDYFDNRGKLEFPKKYWDPDRRIWVIIGTATTVGNGYPMALHFISNNTVEVVYGNLDAYKIGSSGASGKPQIYSVDLGSIVGTVGVYGDYSVTYEYETKDEKMYIHGLEARYTITGSGIQSGGTQWLPYDPNTVLDGHVTNTGSKNNNNNNNNNDNNNNNNNNNQGSKVNLVLKDMLVKPFGTVDVDFQTASYDAIKKKLGSLYKIESYSGTSTYTEVNKKDNPSCANMYYCDLPFSYFYVWKEWNYNSISYFFEIEKSKCADPYIYMERIVKDYNDINIPITYKKKNEGENNTSSIATAYYCKYKTYSPGDVTYMIYLYPQTSTWKFELGINYYK